MYSNTVLDCGRPYIPNQVLILDGTEAKYGSAPWNVGVYRKSATRNNFNMICGGSLIATNLVVSGKITLCSVLVPSSN